MLTLDFGLRFIDGNQQPQKPVIFIHLKKFILTILFTFLRMKQLSKTAFGELLFTLQHLFRFLANTWSWNFPLQIKTQWSYSWSCSLYKFDISWSANFFLTGPFMCVSAWRESPVNERLHFPRSSLSSPFALP